VQGRGALPRTPQAFVKACAKLCRATAVATAEIKGFGKGCAILKNGSETQFRAFFAPLFSKSGWGFRMKP